MKQETRVDATPNVSSFSVGGGLAGLITTAIFVIIGLIGLPSLRWFLAGAVVLGVLVAGVIRLTSRAR